MKKPKGLTQEITLNYVGGFSLVNTGRESKMEAKARRLVLTIENGRITAARDEEGNAADLLR